MKVGLAQLNSQEDREANLKAASEAVMRLADDGCDLVALPEYVGFLNTDRGLMQAHAETFPGGRVYDAMAALAQRLKITLHAGSLVEKAPDGKLYNATAVFGPNGQEIAHYRKIHLFDVDIPGGVRYRESDLVGHGEQVVTYRVGDVTVGAAICYDMRFPELWRVLRDRGAQVIVIPAAFTLATGKDHWEVLLRARAIETQTFVAAVAQCLTHSGGTRACWGHSMVIDPWGHLISQCSDGPGITSARLDFSVLERTRRDLPVANHHVLANC